MRIDPAAVRAIEAAFAAAQARTSAPLVCVVAESSADYALAPTLGAAALALATPWPLIAFTPWPPVRIFLAQLVVFALALGALGFARVRARLALPSRRRSACHRAAVVQFAMRGLDRTPKRNGVLLYVSLSERYARVVADAGVGIPEGAWRDVIRGLCESLRRGEPKSALTEAAGRTGSLLAQQFPATPQDKAPLSQRFHIL